MTRWRIGSGWFVKEQEQEQECGVYWGGDEVRRFFSIFTVENRSLATRQQLWRAQLRTRRSPGWRRPWISSLSCCMCWWCWSSFGCSLPLAWKASCCYASAPPTSSRSCKNSSLNHLVDWTIQLARLEQNLYWIRWYINLHKTATIISTALCQSGPILMHAKLLAWQFGYGGVEGQISLFP